MKYLSEVFLYIMVNGKKKKRRRNQDVKLYIHYHLQYRKIFKCKYARIELLTAVEVDRNKGMNYR